MTYQLIPFILQSIVLGHVYGTACLALGFARSPHYQHGVLVVVWRDWWARRWRYSTTIGHCIGLHPDHESIPDVVEHEGWHVFDYEDLAVLASFVAAALWPFTSWKVALGVYASGGALWLLPGFFVAVVRYKRRGVSWLDAIYRGSWHEQNARAKTKHLDLPWGI